MNFSFGQKISIDNSLTATELINDYLVDGCVEVSNITSSVNGSVNGFSSFGYFERDLSNFPFENGIMLTTGNANSGGNTTNDNILNDGEPSWGTDPDLENALGITNMLNATTIEFDFTSISNLIQFNYILASEEYFGNFPCEYSDGFAFLIRPSGTTDPYTNIALIPGTSIPVNTNTIHDEIVGFCSAENDEYFDGYTLGDTNYNGRTVILTALANIIPNVEYHIKLVIADQTDENYDSAVFIQGNSFNPTVELGPDITTCAEYYEINADIQNPLATYDWFLNDALISNETDSSLTAEISGYYQVQITIPLGNTDCIIEDLVQVTLDSEQTAAPLPDYEICDDMSSDGIETFDLNTMDGYALAAVPPANYSISYHYTLSDAQNNINAITTTIQNASNPQTIHVRIDDIDSGCLAYSNFDLVVNELPDIVSPNIIQLCDDTIADGSTTIDLTSFNFEITQGNTGLNVTYHYTQVDADNGDNPIPSTYVNTFPNESLFVRVVNALTGCISTTSFILEILERPIIDLESIPAMNACEQDDDGFEIFDLTEVIPEILDGLTNVSVSFYLTSNDAELEINAISNEENFQNTSVDFQIVFVRIESTLSGCFSIVPLALHTNLLVTGANVQNYSVCDDQSADGIADFDLLDVADYVVNDLENVTISFYETEDDLTNLSNPIDQNVPYEVVSSPQTIYIHIQDPSCERDVQIDLVISAPVILQSIDPIDYCDTDSDGMTSIDLSSFDALVANGLNDVSVFYFLTSAEANAETIENALPPFHTNTTNPITFYARVRNDLSYCYDIMPFEVNVIPAPAVNQPEALVICDDDQDAFSIIDLNAMIPEIVTDTTDLSISFHTSQNDANINVNNILTPNAFNASTQTIYVRVESSITTCFALAEINVIVNTAPIFSPISNFQNCETDGNLIADFLFSEKDDEILNGQAGKVVNYFETETDALDRTNLIDKNTVYNNLSSPQTIWVRVENETDQNCFGVSSFILEVGSIPVFTAPTNRIVCDDISNDGVEEFDLQDTLDEIVMGSPENLEVSFHLSVEDAEQSINQMDLNYYNIENPQQIYARIDNGTYCHAIAEFGLNVVQVPTVNLPTAIQTCDDDYDGFSLFDLTISEFEILDIRDDDIVVSYFESTEDLEANINPITDPDNYTNTSNPQTVHVQILNLISECYVEIPLELIVNLPPEINPISELYICDNDFNTFDLDQATDILIDDPTNLLINYYLSESDAENQVNALSDPYTYPSDNETIFIRTENINTSCYRIQSFQLIVNPIPIANTPTDLEACDDDFDFEQIFDLSVQDHLVLGNQDESLFTITYYETILDANIASNSIQDINYYAYDGQIIYVRIENNSTSCYATTSFNIIVNRKPLVDIEEQVICLDNLPLTVVAGTIVDGDTYLWSTGASNSEINIEEIGTYSVTVITPEGCETSTTFNVIESEPAAIEVTETVDFSDPNNITITISGIGDYLYILDDGETQESNVFESVSLGYHTVTVIDLNGCGSVTTEVLVIDAPKFVTPNGDGYFDTWHIVGVETLPGTTIEIFDRYGKQLASLTSSSAGWDGKYNGYMMPSNDYWFVANVIQGNRQFQVSGHFALRR